MSDKPITEHPDVQRLISQVVVLQQEKKRLRELIKSIREWCHGSKNYDWTVDSLRTLLACLIDTELQKEGET